MKAGNTKQSIALSFAAIGAIGFLVTRLIPGDHKVAELKTSDGTASGARIEGTVGLPTDIVRDAFSHPKLVERFEVANAQMGVGRPPEEESGYSPLSGFIGNPMIEATAGGQHYAKADGNPSDGADGKGNTGTAGAKQGSAKPSGSAVKGQQLKKGPELNIRLKAIMHASKPLALLSFGDGPDVLAEPGQRVTVPLGATSMVTYRVGVFSRDGVQLISPTGKFWIYMDKADQK